MSGNNRFRGKPVCHYLYPLSGIQGEVQCSSGTGATDSTDRRAGKPVLQEQLDRGQTEAEKETVYEEAFAEEEADEDEYGEQVDYGFGA